MTMFDGYIMVDWIFLLAILLMLMVQFSFKDCDDWKKSLWKLITQH